MKIFPSKKNKKNCIIDSIMISNMSNIKNNCNMIKIRSYNNF